MAAWDKDPLVSGKQPAWMSDPLANAPAFKPTGPGAITAESDRAAVKNAGGAMAVGRNLYRQARDFGAGAIRGAGSIGATILQPVDMAMDAALPHRSGETRNLRRRRGITRGLGNLGADTNSTQFAVGKFAGEIAGTAARVAQ